MKIRTDCDYRSDTVTADGRRTQHITNNFALEVVKQKNHKIFHIVNATLFFFFCLKVKCISLLSSMSTKALMDFIFQGENWETFKFL